MNPTRSSKPAMRHFLAPIGAVVPVEPAVTLADGTTTTFVWPVDVWAGTRDVTRTLPIEGMVRKIVIDPDAWYPDVDRTNNSWERPAG